MLSIHNILISTEREVLRKNSSKKFMSEINELIYYSKDNKIAPNVFDSNGWSAEKKKEFLSKYAESALKWNDLNSLDEKVITEDELFAATQLINKSKFQNPEVIDIDTMNVSLEKKAEFYKGWQFYTKKVSVLDGCLHLNDGETPPLPCAKYEFKIDSVREICFSVKIDKAFFAPVMTDILETTQGKCIEIKQGIEEIIKFQFYTNGTVYYKAYGNTKYHYKSIMLCNFNFNTEITFKILIKGKLCDIYINDDIKINDLPLNNAINPDTIMIYGGLLPSCKWNVKPLCIKSDDKTIKDFFIKCIQKSDNTEYLGKKTMPFSVGTYINKDKNLILEQEFVCEKGIGYDLQIGSVDPGGKIYVNDMLIHEADDFLSIVLDISSVVVHGINKLKIVVNPRASEVLYPWHRHNDPYNGWFCSSVKIRKYITCYKIKDVRIKTLRAGKISKVNISGIICSDKEFSGECILYLDKEKAKSVRCTKNKFSITFFKKIALWSPENPYLYDVSLKIVQHGKVADIYSTKTGFRTISQRNGSFYLNGREILLKGALLMQFLPPYENIPVNHNCPSDEEIIKQVLMAKKQCGNTIRLHILGYGTNDSRFAEICDRLGMMLIWTTRLIDSLESVAWQGEWKQSKAYQRQMCDVINHSSIIMWEGSNEFHSDLKTIDKMYDSFVDTVKMIDTTRLISPCSHMYYGGGIYDMGCEYYQDNGRTDQEFIRVNSSFGWKDKLVVRSAHTYELLLGYGSSWKRFEKQNWKSQKYLFNSKKHAYMVSEFAVIGRENPSTEEAKIFFNPDSYELADEDKSLGFKLGKDDWMLSQAYQSICITECIKQLRKNNVDGMLWCCLSGGANNASYLKPTIDFYGHAKLGFYSIKQGYSEVICFADDFKLVWKKNHLIKPVINGIKDNKRYDCTVTIRNLSGNIVKEKVYYKIKLNRNTKRLKSFLVPNMQEDYYTIHYKVTKSV